MALHGGTGLSDERFRKAIARGWAKVNIATNLKNVFVQSFVDYHRKAPNRDLLEIDKPDIGAMLLKLSMLVSKHVGGSSGPL